MKKTSSGPKLIAVVMFAYLFLPFVITFMYSLATKWSNTILPEGYTLSRYFEMFTSQRFWLAMFRSIFISASGVAAAVLVITPLAFAITAYTPKLESLMKGLTLLPYAIPGVINAAALLGAYGGTDLPMVLILSGAYFILILPLMYSGISNAMRSMDIIPITEASRVLGASALQTFMRIIVPGVTPGILVSTLLSFSTLFGEFVVANMLIGGGFETVQIYLNQIMRKTGHLSSAIVVIYVLIMTAILTAVIKISTGKKHRQEAGREEET
jgi:putative spermidine/putrescine transport system permease protein